MDEKEPKKYEIGYLAKEENDDKIIKDLLQGYQAEIIDEGKLQKIKLSYPIKKESSAYFGFIHFSLSPEKVKDLSGQLKLNSKILRSIVINWPKELEEAQQAIPKRPERPSREKTRPVAEAPKKSRTMEAIDTELLEKKLEEILK